MPTNPQSDAPGRLEDVRRLLNLAPDEVPAPLRELRADLLEALESDVTEPVQRWIARLTPKLAVHPPARLELVPHDDSEAAAIVAAVAEAFASGTWARLRACRDCHWAFYDHSRSGTRVWCGMYATGPQGRACGSIAKTRRYRSRLSG